MMSDTPRNRYGLLDHLEWTEERHAAQIRKFAPIVEDVDLAIENMGRYIDRLEAKLEIADEHGYDGIDCRDETIKLLDANLKKRNQQLSTERARADRLEAVLEDNQDSAHCACFFDNKVGTLRQCLFHEDLQKRADKAEEALAAVKRKHEWNVGLIRGIADAIKPLCSTEQRDAIDKAMKGEK